METSCSEEPIHKKLAVPTKSTLLTICLHIQTYIYIYIYIYTKDFPLSYFCNKKCHVLCGTMIRMHGNKNANILFQFLYCSLLASKQINFIVNIHFSYYFFSLLLYLLANWARIAGLCTSLRW